MTQPDDRRQSGATVSPMGPLPGMVGGLLPGKGPISAMRWVDHWVGMPLCFLYGFALTLSRAIFPRVDPPVREDGIIVIIKFFGLGSIMQATPLMRAIRQRYPKGRLVFLTFPSNRVLLERLGLCTEIHVIRNHSPFLFVHDTLREILWMRLQRVDATVDLEFFSKFSTLLAALGGGCKRIGYHLNAFWRSSLISHPVFLNYYHHISDIFARAGVPLDAPVGDLSLSPIELNEAARASVNRYLAEAGWGPPVRLIGVNVNAGDLSLERRWPPENFARVMAALLERHPETRIVLTGSPDEAAYVRGVFDRMPEPLRDRLRVTAGVWSLDEFVAALGRMTCFITNDSGPMHLAAAQGVPMVSLWGPARPEFYAPRVERHEIVYENFNCSPCLFYMFTTFEGLWCGHQGWCMQAIQAARVIEAAERLLADGSQLPPAAAGLPASPGGSSVATREA